MSSLHPRLQIKIIGIGLFFFALLVWGISAQLPTPSANSYSVTADRCASFMPSATNHDTYYSYAPKVTDACTPDPQD